jgi:hypothetical protein
MVTPDPVTTKVMPPDESMAGTNGYNHECEAYGGFPNYGVCLFTLEAIEEKRLEPNHPCALAVQTDRCPAIAMRKRERDENRALYYIDRREREREIQEARKAEKVEPVVNVDYESESYKRGYAALDPKPQREKAPRAESRSTMRAAKRAKVSDAIIAPGMDYAAALNKNPGGMSLLEMAKQMQARRESK